MSSEPVDYDIVIVGAGIAGSALAVALRDSGLRLAVIEPAPLSAAKSWPPADSVAAFAPRVSAITPKSQQFFQNLGIWGAVTGRACAYRHMTVWDGDGTGQIQFDAADVASEVLGHIVENRVMTSALVQAMRDAPAITLLNPASLNDCWAESDGRQCLVLDTGQHVHSHLVVGADGAHSPLRAMLGLKTREWAYDQQALVATIEVENSHCHTAWQRFLSTGPLAFLPLASDNDRHYCSIVWSMDNAHADRVLVMDDNDFLKALGEASEHCLGKILASSPRHAFPLHQRHAVDYVVPGAALVGDAAHSLHPLAGQGINLGLSDVQVLAEELRRACSRALPIGDMAVLRRYQRQRKTENLAMMAAMDGFKHLFGHNALPLRWLRNTGLNSVDKLGPVKQQLIRHAMGLSSTAVSG